MPSTMGRTMPFTLKPLPYDQAALEPVISARTMEFHYGKHHKGYVDKLNKLTATAPLTNAQLEDVIVRTWGKPEQTKIFDNAAQVWNHDFFWQSMMPSGGESTLGGSLTRRIDADFGAYDKFEETFVGSAVDHFGSGYAWLVEEAGRLSVITTQDAVPPIVLGLRPLLTCDLWEHAYYLDHQNQREKFVRGFLEKLANWDFAEAQLTATHAKPPAQRPEARL
jgi:Fe-Mn family superoxide dismutase